MSQNTDAITTHTAADAYAVSVPDNAMAPRYHTGEVIHVNPARPVTVGCYALVWLAEDDDSSRALIAQVEDISDFSVTLRQFHKEQPIVCDRAVIGTLHRIVMAGEG